jgi:hypothetical protein
MFASPFLFMTHDEADAWTATRCIACDHEDKVARGNK